jgi:hypothetical protein
MIDDEEDRLLHDIDVLKVCRDMLLSGSVSKAHMALILLDALADALLYRRIQRAYVASEETWYLDTPRFPKSVRRRARSNFAERLRLAQEPYKDWRRSSDDSLVTELEAAVLTIAHSY